MKSPPGEQWYVTHHLRLPTDADTTLITLYSKRIKVNSYGSFVPSRRLSGSPPAPLLQQNDSVEQKGKLDKESVLSCVPVIWCFSSMLCVGGTSSSHTVSPESRVITTCLRPPGPRHRGLTQTSRFFPRHPSEWRTEVNRTRQNLNGGGREVHRRTEPQRLINWEITQVLKYLVWHQSQWYPLP